MTYIQLDDTCPDHPSLVGLTDPAFACWVRGLCYSSRHLTDGRIPKAALRSLGTTRAAKELEAAGRWEKTDGGWMIHGYTERQPRTREKVEADRAAARERQARHRQTTPVSRRDTPDGHAEVTPLEVEVEGEVEEEVGQPLPSPDGDDAGRPQLELVVADAHDGPPDRDLLFEAWWGIYPRKVAKADAHKAFTRAIKRQPISLITAGLTRAIAAWEAEDRSPDKIPHAATWLNGDRWNDQHQAPTVPKNTSQGALASFRERAEAASREAHPANRALGRGLHP